MALVATTMRMRNRALVVLAVATLGVAGLWLLDRDHEPLDEDPCRVVPIDVVARSVGASSWDRAERHQDDRGTSCDYLIAGAPILTLSATDRREEDRGSDPAGASSMVCGAAVWRDGAAVWRDGAVAWIRGDRWSLRVQARPAHGQADVDEDLVRVLAREIADSTDDRPGPATLDFDGSC